MAAATDEGAVRGEGSAGRFAKGIACVAIAVLISQIGGKGKFDTGRSYPAVCPAKAIFFHPPKTKRRMALLPSALMQSIWSTPA